MSRNLATWYSPAPLAVLSYSQFLLTRWTCRFIFALTMVLLICSSQLAARNNQQALLRTTNILRPIITGAERMDSYLPLLAGKRVAVAGNHTSMVAGVHLVDTLMRRGVHIVKVFSPEHGFRGSAAAGERVEDSQDPNTGLAVVSLYGSNRRPLPEQMQHMDVILFDMQDVGLRYYTYISTMTYIMEEAARHNIPVIVLDRPNPLGHLVDGPLLKPEHASFVGLHPIPVAHGMTVGEYARMVNGEGWLAEGLSCQLTVITMENYWKNRTYILPKPPSPNLPNMLAVYLYPDLCFFEGTAVSVGRGTDKPFQIFGHPDFDDEKYTFTFTPRSVAAAPSPPHLNALCRGLDLSQLGLETLSKKKHINLTYLLQAYHDFEDKPAFFNAYFEKLAGTDELRHQIETGLSEDKIRASWQAGLEHFKSLRKKYLLYPDE